MKSEFVYVSYIKTTPKKLWHALTSPQLLKQYWIGMVTESDWQVGSAWTMRFPDGRIADTGEIVEFVALRHMQIKWRNEWQPELRDEGFSLCTFDLEQAGEVVKLTLTHGLDLPKSKFIEAVSDAWPICLSNLKSLLETGDVILKDNPRHE
jgi:uncharacterized protein YndB with AHSA1/START domain